MLKTTVKVGQISNLSDARYCAGMGVDMLGFLLDTESAIDMSDVKEITEWVEGCKFVAEFQDSKPEEIIEIIGDFPFDYIQVNSKEIANDLAQKLSNKELIIEGDATIYDSNASSIKYFISPELNKKENTLYSGEINLDNIESILSSKISGIQLLGSEEIRPGFKDFDELADILEYLEID